MPEPEPFLQPFDGPAEELRSIIEPALAALDLELVQLFYVRAAHKDTVRVFTDRKDGGITMAEIEKANRVLGDLLDVEDNARKLFAHAYDLEVGSPGLDRPLTKKSHFARAAGAKVRVRTKQPVKEARSFTGTLAAAKDEAIVVDGVEIPFDVIQSAQVIYEFQAPQKPGKPSGAPGKKQKKQPQ